MKIPSSGFIFTLVILFLLTAFKPSQKQFENDEFSVSYPSNWKSSKQKYMDGGWNKITLTKKGWNESGMIIIMWNAGNYHNPEFVENFTKSFEKTYSYLSDDFRQGHVNEGVYNKFKTIQQEYSVTILTVPHRGSISSVYTCGHTFMFIVSEALEDREKNREGFNLIERTFECSQQDLMPLKSI